MRAHHLIAFRLLTHDLAQPLGSQFAVLAEDARELVNFLVREFRNDRRQHGEILIVDMMRSRALLGLAAMTMKIPLRIHEAALFLEAEYGSVDAIKEAARRSLKSKALDLLGVELLGLCRRVSDNERRCRALRNRGKGKLSCSLR